MTNLDSKGGLSVAEIAFFAPALVIALYIVFRHGFKRQQGWIYLVLLSILRLIGASVNIYIETQNDHSQGLVETTAITSAIGTAPLLLILMGCLARLHDGMLLSGRGLPNLVFRAIALTSTAGLVLGIIGGMDRASTKSDTRNTGDTLSKASSIIFLAIYFVLAAISVLTLLRRSAVLDSERKLVYAAIASLPFLLVRVAYSIAVSFASPGGTFYYISVNVYVSAFMQFLMEAIVVSIFVAAGLATPRKVVVPATDVERNADARTAASQAYRGQPGYDLPPQEETKYESNRRFQQPKNLGDYRPSRLIKNALSGR